MAYYIIRENRLLAVDSKAFPGSEAIKGPDPSVTWAALDKAYAAVVKALEAGEAASGFEYEDPEQEIDAGRIVDGVMVLPPPCYFCDFTGLCLAGRV